MASRRLDISSLLCDDSQPSFSPLDVLVQAATEERRRLTDHHDPQPDPRRYHHEQDRAYRLHVPDLDCRPRDEAAHFERHLPVLPQHDQHLHYQQQQQRREAERTTRDLERELQARNHIDRQRSADEQQQQQQRRPSFSPRDSRFVLDNPFPLPAAAVASPPPHTSSPPRDHHHQRPHKKRRYSLSPVRPIPVVPDRIAPDREPIVAYATLDSPLPRRPGSAQRKAVAVADLLSDKESHPRPVIPSSSARRSPPGSQFGRAKAARKSDEYIASLKEQHTAPPPLNTKFEEGPTPPSDDSRQKKEPPPPPSSSRQDDPHEWFLHQYDQVATPAPKSVRSEPFHMPSPSPHPLTMSTTTQLPRNNTKSPLVVIQQQQQRSFTPVTVSLERELEDLVSSPTPPRAATTVVPVPVPNVEKREESDDMDRAVDLAVTEMLEDALEEDDRKNNAAIGMEVDVDSELLSLVDDHPPSNSETFPGRPFGFSTLTGPVSTSNAASSVTALQVQRTTSDSHSTSKLTKSVSTAPPPPPVARQSSGRTTSERDSMPPPPPAATTTKGGASKKAAERASSSVPPEPTSTASTVATTTTTKKKKETTAKASNAKLKSAAVSAKPKAKSTAKSKKTSTTAPLPPAEGNSTNAPGRATPPPVTLKATKGAAGKKTARSASGSRSASVVPAGGGGGGTPAADVDKAEKQEEEEEADNEDDKLYCLCKTKYDENRFMIACDRCDDWYHTQCVDLSELDVDLIDQFICPSCIEKHSHLNLRTTYKQRCLWGLRHPDPDSPKACHKAARGAFSKYCSDECGVNYMQSRVDIWSKKGGKTDKLWDSVKHAERREGAVVVCAVDLPANMEVDLKREPDQETNLTTVKSKTVRTSKSKVERETERSNILLSSIVAMREEIQRGMEIVVCRERLLQLASERAEQVGQCGWDQRLCCDDDELADIGAGMLETYEDSKVENGKAGDGDGGMDVDGADEQWWCPGKKVCDRHAGWQTIRYKDVCKEKETKEEALLKLITRESEIRTRIENLLDPDGVTTKTETIEEDDSRKPPLKSSTAKLVNGHSKSKASTTAEKKSKKRKAPGV